MSDLHVLPENDSVEHTETADCPCHPTAHEARGRMLYNHHPADGPRPGGPAASPGVIFAVEPPCPIEEALIEWMRCAYLRKDGVVTHEGVNLVGNRENARRYAKLIADHIKAEGPDPAKLTDHLGGTTGAGAHVRVWNFAGHIAEGALEELRRKGLVPA
jgi:hypothetical protein